MAQPDFFSWSEEEIGLRSESVTNVFKIYFFHLEGNAVSQRDCFLEYVYAICIIAK